MRKRRYPLQRYFNRSRSARRLIDVLQVEGLINRRCGDHRSKKVLSLSVSQTGKVNRAVFALCGVQEAWRKSGLADTLYLLDAQPRR